MPVLLDSASLWKEGSGYYPQTVERLSVHPQLPDFRRWRDKRFFELFRRFADLGPGRRALVGLPLGDTSKHDVLL